MTEPRFDEATQPQIRAADPRHSSWVSANAGSGKTRVLTDRVARLLLAGTPPERILCLTFTNAAASNMQNRLVETLGGWAMLGDERLAAKLSDLGEDPESIDRERMAQARTLFAQALETPGGLKIQTIHAFSTALLRRFPLEAGVSPQFTTIDSRAEALLRERILETLGTNRQQMFDRLADHVSMNSLLKLVPEIEGNRDRFSSNCDKDAIWSEFGIDPALDEQELFQGMFLNGDIQMLESLANHLKEGPATDAKAADLLDKLDKRHPGPADRAILERVFLFGKTARVPFGPKTGRFPTQNTRKKMGDRLTSEVERYMDRVSDARIKRMNLNAASKTLTLHRFANAYLSEHETQMRDGAFQDFLGLILKARELVKNPEMAPWVLFRLDGGIDHILVDEAQDVNPEHWEIVASIADEFTSGMSARGNLARSVFAVGDEKQSIFGFQGAAPERFAEMKRYFEGRFRDAGKPFVEENLKFSFRSSQAILSLVDQVFAGEDAGFGGGIAHRAFKSKMPGRIDLWPFISKERGGEPLPWHDPGSEAMPADVEETLAKDIAEHVRKIVSGEMIPEGDCGERRAQPGDILILVQRRNELFNSIIQELKAKALPVAGKDRLRISEELAIRDLKGLLSFLAVPSDNLSLAAVLRSPIFGLDEDQLFSLAHGRGEKSLWSALRESSEFSDVREVLNDLQRHARSLKPYDLLERILTVHKGREKLVARLGHEIEEATDALLNQALEYEDDEAASLTGFLERTSGEDQEIKRQLDQAGNEIRVMSVHGAKGLEAPIVILPDTAIRSISFRDSLLFTEGGMPVPNVKQEECPPLIQRALDSYKEKEEMERRRLLYVALTRAESWLIVCGAGNIENVKEGRWCWYDRIEQAMNQIGADKNFPVKTDENGDLIAGRRLQVGTWPGMKLEEPLDQTADVALEDWIENRATVPVSPFGPRSPSDLGGEKSVLAEAGESDQESAMKRGAFLHLLLEMMPGHAKGDRKEAARDLLFSNGTEISEAEFSDIFDECTRILDDPGLAHLFSEAALVEVGITASLQGLGGDPILGYIDRLVISDDKVLAVDFKSNRDIPSSPAGTPEGILRQMGAYHEALQAIYPEREVNVAILWTRPAQLMKLSAEDCLAALARAEPLDAAIADF